MVKRPKTRTARILSEVGSELKENPPAILAKTKRKDGEAAAERQRRVMMFSKARREGARIPRAKS